jgi:quercetin dioxygenase-like cupin family protein
MRFGYEDISEPAFPLAVAIADESAGVSAAKPVIFGELAMMERGGLAARLARILGAAAMAASIAPVAVHAASCPAGKGGVDVRAPNNTPAKGVTDTVITSIDLSKEPEGITGRLFRLRKLTIAPGGVVPWHSHGNRPAIIYIVKGEITEYSSDCSVPIVHRAGDSTPELHTTSHWWKNTGKTTVVLLSADLFPTGADAHMM